MRFSLHLTLIGFLVVTCWHSSFCLSATADEANIVSMPFTARTGSESSTLFEELSPSDTGIDFIQPIDITHPQKAIYVGGYASPGIAIGDLNGDGLPDLAVTGGPVKNRLYLQIAGTDGQASMRFRDASDETKFGIRNDWSAGVTLVDIDNDGDLDIYVCNYDAANQLFINQTSDPAKPQFEELAKAYGLDLIDASFTAAFSDYDLDGDLDVLV